MIAAAWNATRDFEHACWVLLAAAVLAALLVISAQSIVSLCAAALLSGTLALACFGQAELSRCSRAFICYAAFGIAIYLLQLLGFPDYFGFSGPPGIGTDDSYYFSLAAPEVPAGLAVRPYYFMEERPYSNFLKLFAEPAHRLFGEVHALDLVFLNVAILALLPSATALVARTISDRPEVERGAWWLTLLCPFLVANGVVLLRDGLVAVCTAVALCAFLCRRYSVLIASLLAATYLRPEHGLLVLGMIWVLFWVRYSEIAGSQPRGPSMLARMYWIPMICIPAVAVGLLLLVIAPRYLPPEVLANLALRGDFLETFVYLGAGGDPSSSLFYQISHLPWVARLPLALAFYFVSPLSDVVGLISATAFVIRDWLYSGFGLLMIVYAGFFTRGAWFAIESRNRILMALIILYLVELLIISQASMQLRHKVPLVPMFYVVVAIGACFQASAARVVAIIVSFAVGASQILLTGWRFATQ